MTDVDGAERLARLIRIEEKIESLRREFALELREVKEDLGEMKRAIEGPPRSESLRGRLHLLETSDAAAVAAKAALDATSLLRDQRWSKRERTGLFAIAVVGMVGTVFSTIAVIVTLFGIG